MATPPVFVLCGSINTDPDDAYLAVEEWLASAPPSVAFDDLSIEGDSYDVESLRGRQPQPIGLRARIAARRVAATA